MSRRAIHLILDAGAGAAFIGMVSTGLAMRYVLPPVNAAQDSITLLLGFTRPEWVGIHFHISIALMAILAVHFFLHWRWLIGAIKNQPTEHSGIRFGLGMAGLLTVLLFAAAPFLGPKRNIPRYRQMDEISSESLPSIKLRDKFKIHGSMTLQDVERQTGIPVDVLLAELGLPANISPDSQVERLSRVYEFDMQRIHEIVDSYEETGGPYER